MPKTYELYLRVTEADQADFDKSVIRIHQTNKPQGIAWGDYIDISLDKKNWVTCKLEPAHDIGMGRIYIGIPQRGLLSKDAFGQRVRVGELCNLYVRKVFKWNVFLWVAIAAIVIIAIAFLISSLVQ